MFKNSWLILVISIAVCSCKQKDIKSYVTENLVPIQTISPDSTDFSELEKIGKAIGDSRIVMLGEQDHGDAPTFIAKTRLIKYLHEKMGFNVLAFESDFFALNAGWDQLEKQKNKMDPFVSENIFNIWTKCMECEHLLFEYIPSTFLSKKPLMISGFDNQVHGSYSTKNLRSFMDNYLKRKKINFTKTENYKIDFLSFIDSISFNRNIEKQRNFKKALAQIHVELAPMDSTAFESILLKSLKTLTEKEISFLSNGNDYLEIRDRQMAENLKWLVKYKFPNEKVIVWAHNCHILKHPGLVKITGLQRSWKNMGDFFTADKQFDKQSYILGFTSRSGTAGRVLIEKKYTVPAPEVNSFESWIPVTVPYAFVDFKRYRKENPNMKTPFLMKGRGHFAEPAPWSDIFDGIFYIRDMYFCSLGIGRRESN